MENKKPCQRDDNYSPTLTNELQQGKDLARQLQMLLLQDPHSSTSSSRSFHDTREFLVQQIIASFDRAVSMANHPSDPLAPSPPPLPPVKSESPLSGSEDSDPVGEDSTRRKRVQPRWTTKVQVSPETGFEGPPGDGYNWRKYGQKDILGANFPRAYYRCALKHQTNCPATKQVQRCDEDPCIFEVTYRSLHACNHPVINPNQPSSSSYNPNQPPPQRETLISFDPNNASFIIPKNSDLHNQHLLANPNPEFHFHASSMTATSAVLSTTTTAVRATSSASATSSPINITHDFPFDPFDDFDSTFFH
uniref:WRKY transcription factor n=1 Tax=Fagopyrum tataricum TaxID=62330 RepID=A0A4P9Q2M6_FAGTA|nr:WRKY transcription factor [Fagopyrum tataricum]